MPVPPRSPWRRALHRWRRVIAALAVVSAVLLLSRPWWDSGVPTAGADATATPGDAFDPADLPPGTVAVPVAVADPASAALAQSGSLVTLLVTQADGEVRRVDSVTVISTYGARAGSAAGSLVSGDGSDTFLVVAIPHEATTLVTESQLPVRVAIPAGGN